MVSSDRTDRWRFAVANHSSANGRELVDERGGRSVGRLGVGVGGSAPLRAIAAALFRNSRQRWAPVATARRR